MPWLLWLKCLNCPAKFLLFIQVYHAPYNPKHRYWTGLLLVARIILYVTFAANVEGDPKVNLIAIGVVVVSILIVRNFLEGNERLYQKRPIEMLEIACHFNLIILCIVTFFTLEDNVVKNIVAQTSISVTIALLLGVLIYHLFTEVFFKTKLCMRFMEGRGQCTRNEINTPVLNASNVPQPTSSVVEAPKELYTVLMVGKGGRGEKNSDFPCELKQILLDDSCVEL